MADNVFKRVYNAVVNKHQTYSLQGGRQSTFQLIGNSIKRLFGMSSLNEFTKAYGSNPLVYMIVHKISFTSASIKRVAEDSSGNEMKEGSSKVLELLENPNPEQGQIEFLEEINEWIATTGNAFIRFIKGVGAGESLEILIASNVEIICSKSGDVIKYRYTKVSGSVVDYEPEDILHIKSSNIVNTDTQEEVKFGLSPLQAGWVVVKSSDEKFNAEASIFKNRGMIGFVTNDTDVPILETERERTQKQFNREAGGSEKYNSIYVTNTRLRFVQTGMSPTDLKLLEGIVNSLRLLAALYGMPSVLFNDMVASTFNNFDTAIKVAYNDVYIPLANKVDAKLSVFISERIGVEETIRVDLTSIEVIKATTNEILQTLNSMPDRLSVIAINSMTDDEVRDVLGLDDLQTGQTTIGQAATATPPTEEST